MTQELTPARLTRLARDARRRWLAGLDPRRSAEAALIDSLSPWIWRAMSTQDHARLTDRVEQRMRALDAIAQYYDRADAMSDDLDLELLPPRPAEFVPRYRPPVIAVNDPVGFAPRTAGARAGTQPEPGVFARRFVCLCPIDKWSIHARCCGIGRKVR